MARANIDNAEAAGEEKRPLSTRRRSRSGARSFERRSTASSSAAKSTPRAPSRPQRRSGPGFPAIRREMTSQRPEKIESASKMGSPRTLQPRKVWYGTGGTALRDKDREAREGQCDRTLGPGKCGRVDRITKTARADQSGVERARNQDDANRGCKSLKKLRPNAKAALDRDKSLLGPDRALTACRR